MQFPLSKRSALRRRSCAGNDLLNSASESSWVHRTCSQPGTRESTIASNGQCGGVRMRSRHHNSLRYRLRAFCAEPVRKRPEFNASACSADNVPASWSMFAMCSASEAPLRYCSIRYSPKRVEAQNEAPVLSLEELSSGLPEEALVHVSLPSQSFSASANGFASGNVCIGVLP
jgi:hypothetical protein